MATYKPGIASAALGSLLRKVQEEKEAQPHRVPPSASETSPIRAQVQPPITAPESTGSEKVVALKPELRPTPEAPTTTAGGITPQVVGFPKATPSVPGAQVVGFPGSPVAPSGGGEMPSTPAASSTPRVSTTLLPSSARNVVQPSRAVAGKQIVSPQAHYVEQSGPAGREQFGSEAAFQKAQTPVQNILGGIGKVGTSVTTSLGLPQLLPGGAFKKLQDVMAPILKKRTLDFGYRA